MLRLLAVALLTAPAVAQVSGSVLLVDRIGNHVEANSFVRSAAVFLAGGPGTGCSAPGLPDGDYCYQITDPAGIVLLSPEAITERTVRVQGGVISQYLGTKHLLGSLGPCGGLNLQLAPFVTSPFPEREYKLWLTLVADYDPSGAHLFGFDPARSKSDNFKVGASGPQTILRGHKFYDHSGDGLWDPAVDPLEVPIGGWRVELELGGVPDGTTYTDQDGWYIFIRDRDGSSYDAHEVSPNGFVNDGTPGATWLATTPRSGAIVAKNEHSAGPEFGNVNYAVLPGAGRTKGFWHNSNGRARLALHEPLWREVLTTRTGAPVNLRRPISSADPAVSIFTPLAAPATFQAAFADFAAYIVQNAQGHAGFMLSSQVAATLLNNTAGFMPGSIFVDRFQDGVLVSLDELLAGAIGLFTEEGAGLTGPGDPYQDLRNRMLACLNEFATINNTGDPAAPQIVYSRQSSPGLFFSPY
jgi:hypothetical protein